MAFARAVHFAALLLPAGAWTFAVLVAPPAVGAAIRRPLEILTWIGLAAGLASGLVWLVFQASSMTGFSPEDVLSDGTALSVLTHTRLGAVWQVRGVIAIALAGVLLVHPARRWVDLALLALSAALLGGLAWSGHAGADGELLHLISDAIHLLAAGAWVGALLPLIIALKRTADQAETLALTRKFSTLGVISVAALAITGIINSLLLVGTLPALVGTPYGQILVAKIVLFIAMVLIASINRLRLTPRLPGPDWRGALSHLRRNALAECFLGLGVLALVGHLGTLPPGAHEQPWWPFPLRLSFEAVSTLSDLLNEALLWTGLTLLGLGLLAFGAIRGKRWIWAAPLGLLLCLFGGWRLLPLVTGEAYPTSFYSQTEAFTTASLGRGETLYRQNCTSCHGAEGRGDGPAFQALRIPPADLTAEHLFDHSDGDLFWWISRGMGDDLMPGFEEIIPEAGRWDLINFLHARASGVLASDMAPVVTAFPAPLAPDFSFEAAGRETTLLLEAQKGGAVVEFSATTIRIEGRSFGTITLPMNPEIRAAYHLFESRSETEPLPEAAPEIAFLIDRAGMIRARWSPGDQPDWREKRTIDEQMKRMEAMPLKPRASTGHQH